MRPQGTKLPNATCETCGTAFYRSPSAVSRSRQRYCSPACYTQMRHERRDTGPTKPPNATCEMCGKAFYRSRYYLTRASHHYCSHACYSQARQERRCTEPTTVCALCGRPLRRSPSQLARRAAPYCSRACQTRAWAATQRGARNTKWKGGRTVDRHGYVWITLPDGGTVTEHRYVMEQDLGRPLRSDEYVHHKNGIKSDNRRENLQLISPGAHSRLHNPPLTTWAKGYDHCRECGTTARRHAAQGLCQRCYAQRKRRSA